VPFVAGLFGVSFTIKGSSSPSLTSGSSAFRGSCTVGEGENTIVCGSPRGVEVNGYKEIILL
jgi:hypothetical protein